MNSQRSLWGGDKKAGVDKGDVMTETEVEAVCFKDAGLHMASQS